jgi:cobalt-precorrin 5A hydrolase
MIGNLPMNIEKVNKTAIFALTEKGSLLALKLAKMLEDSFNEETINVFIPKRLKNKTMDLNYELNNAKFFKKHYFNNWQETFTGAFRNYKNIICIMAAGIVVRTMAPCLDSKLNDPAVVVVDEKGEYAISLLSGHVGGANKLAKIVASKLGGQAVITTATDVNKKPAVDMLAVKIDATLKPIGLLKVFNRFLAEGKEVFVTSPFPIKPEVTEGFTWQNWTDSFIEKPGAVSVTDTNSKVSIPDSYKETCSTVIISPYIYDLSDTNINDTVKNNADIKRFSPYVMQLLPKNLVVGIGCRRGVLLEDVESAYNYVLDEFKINGSCIKCLATIDFKGEEGALRLLSKKLQIPLITVTKQEINTLEGTFEPSSWVQKTIGVGGVCEPAARIAAKRGITIVPKQKIGQVTISVAMERSWWLDLDRETEIFLHPRL